MMTFSKIKLGAVTEEQESKTEKIAWSSGVSLLYWAAILYFAAVEGWVRETLPNEKARERKMGAGGGGGGVREEKQYLPVLWPNPPKVKHTITI